jgi:hypothetical protein
MDIPRRLYEYADLYLQSKVLSLQLNKFIIIGLKIDTADLLLPEDCVDQSNCREGTPLCVLLLDKYKAQYKVVFIKLGLPHFRE